MLKKTVAGYITFFPRQSELWRKGLINGNSLGFISSQNRYLSLGPCLNKLNRWQPDKSFLGCWDSSLQTSAFSIASPRTKLAVASQQQTCLWLSLAIFTSLQESAWLLGRFLLFKNLFTFYLIHFTHYEFINLLFFYQPLLLPLHMGNRKFQGACE